MLVLLFVVLMLCAVAYMLYWFIGELPARYQPASTAALVVLIVAAALFMAFGGFPWLRLYR